MACYRYIPTQPMMMMESDLSCRGIRRSESRERHGQPLYMTLRPRPGARSARCPGAQFRHLNRPDMEEYVKKQIDGQHLGGIFELLFGDNGTYCPCKTGPGMKCGRKEEGNSCDKSTRSTDVSGCKTDCNGQSCDEKRDDGQSESQCDSVPCCPESPRQCAVGLNKDGATPSQDEEEHVFQMDKLLEHMFRLVTGQPMEENNDCKKSDKNSVNAKSQQPMSVDQSEQSSNGPKYNCEDKCPGEIMEKEENEHAGGVSGVAKNQMGDYSLEDEGQQVEAMDDKPKEDEIGDEILEEQPREDQLQEDQLLGEGNQTPDDQLKHVPDDRPLSESSSKFSVSFNMADYEPEDMKVRLSNGQLEVSATRDVMEDGMTSHHSMQRMITLPPTVDEDTIKCEFMDNGHMVISADKRNIAEDKELIIEVLA